MRQLFLCHDLEENASKDKINTKNFAMIKKQKHGMSLKTITASLCSTAS